MIKRNLTQKEKTEAKNRRVSRRLPIYFLMLACVMLIVSGFFIAGRQHFSSMEYGMRNSRLRKQIDELQAERRRLLLAREVSLSPAEIKKAAKKTRLVDRAQVSTEGGLIAAATKENTVPLAADGRSMIVRTVAVTSRTAIAFQKPARTEKTTLKTTISAE
jgi:hypothetical protein